MLMDRVDNGVKDVEEKLSQTVNTEVNLLLDASLHIVDSGGKRLRPRLTLLSYLAAGGQNIAEVVPLAAAVELVHTATLVHDDINDHSPTRRGKISVHAHWGRTFALLTGDYLFTKVYELMAPYDSTYNIIMADACVKLVEGETLQAEAAKNGAIDRETYKLIIERKTASLFQAAAKMGALLAGSEESIVQNLSQYAYFLGLAFQMVDDVLDIVGDPDILGKPIGSDAVQGMGGIVNQNGNSVLDGAAAKEADPIKIMLAQLRESGAIEIAKAQANDWANRAQDALFKIPNSPARDELDNLLHLVVHRNR